MRRFWYAKYAATLLASTALTFHLLHSTTTHVKVNSENIFPDYEKPTEGRTANTFTKSSSYLRRKLSRDFRNPSKSCGFSTLTVLPGNITVHEGDEHVP
ncbi:hexosyltransferase [Caerostris extrusa]|uniref:Hexosyltransferase n=1 Tax=Caerostris extrusa TaxID=172846 RepID=A0AAV4V2I7_CAEEX|nr:hexosyltransferase [Caerostris extrusa]